MGSLLIWAVGCGLGPEEQTEGWKAVNMLGWKPGLRVIVLVDAIIIIWDSLLISESLEVTADKP